MSWVRVLAFRVRGLFERKRPERELDDEVRFHLDMQIEDNLKAGMEPEEARYAALRSFGAIEPMKEQYRERRAVVVIETVAQDMRYAARILRKNPGFTMTSVVVLALGIGVSSAMFSVLHTVLLRPLPYRSPEQLAMLWRELPKQNLREGRSAYWNVEQLRSQSRSFTDIAAFDGASGTLTTADDAEKISIARVSANFFALLGVRPLLGRTFSAKEAEQRQRLVLISYRFWQTRFGGSPGAINQSIHADGLPARIIGIVPATFPAFLADADVWEPHTMVPDWEVVRRARGSGFWAVIGRIRANATFEQAQQEMNAIARSLDEQLPLAERNRGISVVPLTLQVTGPRARMALLMLTCAVLCVLLIATTNVGSLSLARSAGRKQEMAIRAALGANRARIVRQLLAENFILAIASGVLGLFVAEVCIRLVIALKPANLARLNEVSLNAQVLGCALALCLFTGILVGLAPAITAARDNLRPSGQEGGRGIAGGVATREIRRALVVTEFALALILLAGAGLLIRSLWSIENVHLGFRPERVLSVQLSTPASMAAGQRANFYTQVLEQIESLPGVESAGVIENFLISNSSEQMVSIEASTGTVSEDLRLRLDAISGGFCKTLGSPLLRGRLFSVQDGPDSPKVAIINDAMARRLLPGRDPVGKRFRLGESGAWTTVVGVVGDMRRQGLENAPVPQVFVPMTQDPSRLATLLVRTSMDDPLRIAGSVHAAVRRVEKYAPLYGVATLDSQIGAFLSERRFQTLLLIVFSGIALVMAAIGIYGLIQYSVAMRTQEIAIRMAVGAQTGEIFRATIGEGLKLCLIGLALGALSVLWLGGAASSLLYGVSATDPRSLISVSLLLVTVATAACYVPARRAMKIEPIVALRQE
jgi:predicted permease